MLIINLTQHQATAEQLQAGVVDLPEKRRQQLCQLLTFEEIPTAQELQERAKAIVDLPFVVESVEDMVKPMPEKALIGGAPFFMSYLEEELKAAFIQPIYSFTKREVYVTTQPDGTIVKTAVFKHIGFVDV